MNRQEFLTEFEKVKVKEFPNQVNSNPEVSVCVQTYQHGKFIRQCLESIILQKTNFNYEILIGEDGSSDETREICIEYAKKYPTKIRLFLHHRENNIHIRNRPTGRFNLLYNLYAANGKYIAICEGDDYWTDENKLAIQYNFLENNNEYAICGHDAFTFNAEGILNNSKLTENKKREFNKVEVQKYDEIVILTVSSFFRNHVQNLPRQILKIVNADSFLFSYLGNFGKYKYIDEIQPAGYRIHEGGAWSVLPQNIQLSEILITKYWLSDLYNELEKPEISDFYKLKMMEILINNLNQLSFQNFVKMSVRLLKRFLKHTLRK